MDRDTFHKAQLLYDEIHKEKILIQKISSVMRKADNDGNSEVFLNDIPIDLNLMIFVSDKHKVKLSELEKEFDKL